MFSNRFNTRNDPLLEAAEAAMKDGETRRQAEAVVNEAFGVYSRKAVVREELADYDAALEEVYAELKEGVQIDEISVSTAWSYSGKKMEKERKGLLPGDHNPSSKTDLKNMKNAAERTDKDYYKKRGFKKVDEELAKKDYDKDGKIESPKDEVWGSRLRAAKLAGKLKEEEQIDEIKMSKIRKLADKGDTKRLLKIGQKEMKKSQKAENKGKYGKMLKHFHKGDVAMNNAEEYHPEAEQIDELSKELAYRAMRKADSKADELAGPNAAKSAISHRAAGEYQRQSEKFREYGNKKFKQALVDRDKAKLSGAKKRRLGLDEEQIDELSKGLLGRYVKKATTDVAMNSGLSGRHSAKRIAAKDKMSKEIHGKLSSDYDDKSVKRQIGIHKAVNKLTKEEQIDEAAYSAKAARAGKDIGKPGKNFAKIAKSAGKRYGSEERGKKVAGAILARIRAKHMKEENLEELSAFGAEFAKQRAAGAKQFSFGGKSYTTAMKGSSSTASSSGPMNRISPAPKTSSGSKYDAGSVHNKTTLNTTAPGQQATVQSKTTEKGWADPGRWENEAKAKTGSMQQIRGGKPLPPSAELGTPKSEVSRQSFLNKELGSASPAVDANRNVPTPPSRPSDLGGSTTTPGSMKISAQPAPVSGPSGEQKMKTMASLKEDVQIGDYKYRII